MVEGVLVGGVLLVIKYIFGYGWVEVDSYFELFKVIVV